MDYPTSLPDEEHGRFEEYCVPVLCATKYNDIVTNSIAAEILRWLARVLCSFRSSVVLGIQI